MVYRIGKDSVFCMIKTDSYIQGLSYYNSVNKKQSEKSNDTNKNVSGKGSSKVDNKSMAGVNGRTKLSDKAESLLDSLKKKYGNMDFMVADFEDGEEAKEILSRGTKEFSVLFSSEELEKMASDEKYLEEKIKGMEGAVRFSERINDEFGYESMFQKNSDGVEVTNVGISFNEDGTMTYFAELEKVNEKQQERMENVKEEKKEKVLKEEKSEKSAKVNKTVGSTKKTVVYADTEEDLVNKIYEIDWSKIENKNKSVGGKLDLSV